MAGAMARSLHGPIPRSRPPSPPRRARGGVAAAAAGSMELVAGAVDQISGGSKRFAAHPPSSIAFWRPSGPPSPSLPASHNRLRNPAYDRHALSRKEGRVHPRPKRVLVIEVPARHRPHHVEGLERLGAVDAIFACVRD